jgi:mannosyltransferase
MRRTLVSAELPVALDEGDGTPEHESGADEPGVASARYEVSLLDDRLFTTIAVTGLGAAIVYGVQTTAMRLSWPYWKDEAIAVTVASLPADEIPGALRFDASPPAYYWLLHFWMRMFGSGESDTALLSALFAIGTVVVVAAAGVRYAGQGSGLLAATWVILSTPWLLLASETRMYTLVTFLVAALVVALVEGFIADRRPFRLTASALLLVLALTHNWGLIFFGAAATWFFLLERADINRLLRRGGYFVVPAIAYSLLWGPMLAGQVRSAVGPGVPEMDGLSAILGVVRTFGGPVPLFTAVTIVSLAALRLASQSWRAPRRQRAVVMLGLCSLCYLIATYLARELLAGWVPRYLVVLIIPVILAISTLAGWTRVGRLFLAMVLTATALFDIFQGRQLFQHEALPTSYAVEINEWLDSEIGPAARTMLASPSSVALLRWYGGPDHRYVTPIGVVEPQGVFDYRNRLSRLQVHDSGLFEKTVDGLQSDDRLVVVDEPPYNSYYFRLQSLALTRWVDRLQGDPDLEMVGRREVEEERRGRLYTVYVFERV